MNVKIQWVAMHNLYFITFILHDVCMIYKYTFCTLIHEIKDNVQSQYPSLVLLHKKRSLWL
jgi:hypothetical protein